jgi:hypothetical protein
MKILGLVLFWAVIFGMAFIVPRFIEPTGSGFTRGTNRLPAVLGLHCFGFLVALFTAGLTLRSKAEITKWLLFTGFMPLVIYLLLIGVVVVVYVGAIITGM